MGGTHLYIFQDKGGNICIHSLSIEQSSFKAPKVAKSGQKVAKNSQILQILKKFLVPNKKLEIIFPSVEI